MASSRAQSASFYLPEVDFGDLFGFVPLPLEQDPDSDIPKPYSSPITFFDRHLDESLILKRITVLPSLISTISEALDNYVSTFNSKNEAFRSPRLYLRPGLYNCKEPPKPTSRNDTALAKQSFYRLPPSSLFIRINLNSSRCLGWIPDVRGLRTYFIHKSIPSSMMLTRERTYLKGWNPGTWIGRHSFYLCGTIYLN